ncbi:hypothetical protein ACHAQH_009401 [Verticillium albo-atrum]
MRGVYMSLGALALATVQANEYPYCEKDNCYRNLIDTRYQAKAAEFCPQWLAGTTTAPAAVPTSFKNCGVPELSSACSCITYWNTHVSSTAVPTPSSQPPVVPSSEASTTGYPVPSVPASSVYSVPSVPATSDYPVPSVPASSVYSVPSVPASSDYPVPSVPASSDYPVPSVPASSDYPVPSSSQPPVVSSVTSEEPIPSSTEDCETSTDYEVPSSTEDVPVPSSTEDCETSTEVVPPHPESSKPVESTITSEAPVPSSTEDCETSTEVVPPHPESSKPVESTVTSEVPVPSTTETEDCETSTEYEVPSSTEDCETSTEVYPVPTTSDKESTTTKVYPVPTSSEEEKTTTVHTTDYTTSTVYTTKVRTITSCAPEITDCPNGPHVTTETYAVSTTVCPVTETETEKTVETPVPTQPPHGYTTSTVYTTKVHTVTSCAPGVTDCPNGPHVSTETIAISTTICPVTEEVPHTLTTVYPVPEPSHPAPEHPEQPEEPTHPVYPGPKPSHPAPEQPEKPTHPAPAPSAEVPVTTLSTAVPTVPAPAVPTTSGPVEVGENAAGRLGSGVEVLAAAAAVMYALL